MGSSFDFRNDASSTPFSSDYWTSIRSHLRDDSGRMHRGRNIGSYGAPNQSLHRWSPNFGFLRQRVLRNGILDARFSPSSIHFVFGGVGFERYRILANFGSDVDAKYRAEIFGYAAYLYDLHVLIVFLLFRLELARLCDYDGTIPVGEWWPMYVDFFVVSLRENGPTSFG